MTNSVTPYLLVKVNRLDFRHTVLEIRFVEEFRLGGALRHANVVGDDPSIDGLCRMRHKAAAAKRGLVEEPGKATAVIEMKVADQQEIDRFQLDLIEKGQRVEAGECGMDAHVE